MKRPLVVLTLLLVIGGSLLLAAASGIVPIKASSGHWAITSWFLHFAMRRSVATHSLGITAPDLEDHALLAKGGRHYEIGCRPCHGSPALHRPRIAAGMTPHPPYLGDEVHEWQPRELFYVVKHGVKFTGMPAWPAQQRDDEVWAVVAFLRRLPELDAAGYRRMAGTTESEAAPIDALTGSRAMPAAIRSSCGRCHGFDGLGYDHGAFPKLAGQKARYLSASLEAYARGERFSGIMQPIAAGLSAAEREDLARYYSNQASGPPPRADGTTAAAVERGAAIAAAGIPARGVPACCDCHGPGEIRRNPIYPRLAGQHAQYLVLQLELFHHGRRGGTPYADIMQKVTHRLEPQQRRDVALYYQSIARHPAAFFKP